LPHPPPTPPLFPYTTLFRSLPAIVPPDLGDTESREKWQLIQGRGSDLDFDHEVGGGIDGRVDVDLAVHPRGALDVETHVGLESRSEEHTSELQSRFDLVCRL